MDIGSMGMRRLAKVTFLLFLFFIVLLLFSIAFRGLSLLSIAVALGYFLLVIALFRGAVRTARAASTFPFLSAIWAALQFALALSLVLFLFVGLLSAPLSAPPPPPEGNISLNGVLLIITALTGLISAIAGLLAQFTARKKTSAEIELEKEKLAIERERLELEKSKSLTARKTQKSKDKRA